MSTTLTDKDNTLLAAFFNPGNTLIALAQIAECSLAEFLVWAESETIRPIIDGLRRLSELRKSIAASETAPIALDGLTYCLRHPDEIPEVRRAATTLLREAHRQTRTPKARAATTPVDELTTYTAAQCAQSAPELPTATEQPPPHVHRISPMEGLGLPLPSRGPSPREGLGWIQQAADFPEAPPELSTLIDPCAFTKEPLHSTSSPHKSAARRSSPMHLLESAGKLARAG